MKWRGAFRLLTRAGGKVRMMPPEQFTIPGMV